MEIESPDNDEEMEEEKETAEQIKSIFWINYLEKEAFKKKQKNHYKNEYMKAKQLLSYL